METIMGGEKMSKTGYMWGMPNLVLYGEGCVLKLGGVLKQLGGTRALLVTDEVLIKTGHVDEMRNMLSKNGITIEVYAGVNREPEDIHVEEGLDIFKSASCDSVIALGGGSCIDAAKGIGIMATNPGKISDYQGRDKVKFKMVPMVAITTTAGTASEISRVSVITDTKRTDKMIIKDEKARPSVAVCDPTFTISMPPSVTASSGMDALTHAIEGFVSRECQPMTEMVALKAIELISRSLPVAWANGKDIEARSNMMLGQLLAGMSFSNASTCTVHGLARPLGAHFHVPHGLSNAMFLPEGMEYTIPACPEKYAKIAQAMGENVKGLNVFEAAEKSVEFAHKLRKMIKVPTIIEYGIDKEQYIKLIPQMAQDGIESGSHNLNPRTPTKEELIELYKQIL
jgi:alcohol dehydrogenase class IV